MKLDKKKLDLENLDSIIRMCEDRMVLPFKKKNEVSDIELEGVEEDSEEKVEDRNPVSDLSDDDLEALMEALKDNKKG